MWPRASVLTKAIGFISPFPREETKAGEEYRARRGGGWLIGIGGDS